MRRTSKGLAIALLLGGAEALGARSALALTELDRLRYDAGTREIVLEARGPITPLSRYRADLKAWVIDFRNARYVGNVSMLGMPDGPLAGLVINQLNPRWVRIAFHLDGHRGSPFSSWRMAGKSYRVQLRAFKSANPPRQRSVPVAAYRGEPLAGRRPAAAPAGVGARPDAWRWRTMSQMLLSTNVAHFQRGPSLAGARLSYQGTHQSYQPIMRGYLLAHIEQQTLRFAESRYDYGSLVTSMALSHPVTPWLHVFEGGALMLSEASAFHDQSFVDADLFGGLGTSGAAPGGGVWYGTLSAERMGARVLRHSYYAQTLRLGYQHRLASADVQIQATLQRVDPMIRSDSTYRAYAYSSMAQEVAKGVQIGVRGLVGTQQSPESFSWFTEGGPFLQATF